MAYPLHMRANTIYLTTKMAAVAYHIKMIGLYGPSTAPTIVWGLSSPLPNHLGFVLREHGRHLAPDNWVDVVACLELHHFPLARWGGGNGRL